MIYLDNGATSLQKPETVKKAVLRAMARCGNPGRSGHGAAMEAAKTVYHTRELAGKLFHCPPEQVVFTTNCTHGLNMALGSLVRPGMHVVISGFEHNAVTRPLHAMGARITVAGRKLFDWEDTLRDFRKGLEAGAELAVFTHASNVFGYILPVEEMAALCRAYGVPFVMDAAQSAGSQPVDFTGLGAAFVAMPGHKGLLGPQGTGILLCKDTVKPLLYGGTGSQSRLQTMPEELPDRAEAGTLNVPGIAGLGAGLEYLLQEGVEKVGAREHRQAARCGAYLEKQGLCVFRGAHQGGTVSFVPDGDCEELATRLWGKGVAVRAGLHCAPLAHESAGTLETGTVRISFGYQANDRETDSFFRAMRSVH